MLYQKSAHTKTEKKIKRMIPKMKKKSTVYWCILVLWAVLSFWGVRGFITNVTQMYPNQHGFLFVVLIINTIFILYFWLSGTKDLIFVFFYYTKRKKNLQREYQILETPLERKYIGAKVLLLYCTCDDFIADSLLHSMRQKYDNFETVIWDDSSTDKYKIMIDEFAQKHRVKVVRREDHVGFKAGNLNHYLSSLQKEDYNFFVILDSDEIIPCDFIAKALHYFSYYPKMGILQASHISNRNRTKFMDRFYLGVNAHWPTYQTIKEQYGFLSLLGHGAMVCECYEATGGFPALVAEDISFSIEAKLKGFFTGFSNLIVCQEEYPIDYFAF